MLSEIMIFFNKMTISDWFFASTDEIMDTIVEPFHRNVEFNHVCKII